jgi:hypothetical protein
MIDAVRVGHKQIGEDLFGVIKVLVMVVQKGALRLEECRGREDGKDLRQRGVDLLVGRVQLLRCVNVEDEGHEVLRQARDDGVELLDGAQQAHELLPGAPVVCALVEALDEVVGSKPLVLAAGEHNAVQILEPALRLAPADGQGSEPGLENGGDGGQLLVQRHATVLRAQDHLAVLVHALLAGNVLGIEGEEEGLLAEPCHVLAGESGCGRRVWRSRGRGRGLCLCGLVLPRLGGGKKDGGAAVELATVKVRLREQVLVRFAGLEARFGRVFGHKVGRVREGRVRHGRVDVGVGAMVVARGGQRGEQFCGPWSTSAAAEPVGEQYAPLGRVVQAALGARYDRVLQLRLELRLIGRRKGAHGDVGVSVSVVVVVVVLWTARVCRSGACACVCVFVVSWFRVFL